MENLFASIAKLRHPFSALTGAGLALSLAALALDVAALSAGELTMYSLAAVALGAGIGGLASTLAERAWLTSREERLRFGERRKRAKEREVLKSLPIELRGLVGKKICADKYQSPHIEFCNHELHYAERLYRDGVVQRNPNQLTFTFTRSAWGLLCEDPALFGLERKVDRDIYRGAQEVRFVFRGIKT